MNTQIPSILLLDQTRLASLLNEEDKAELLEFFLESADTTLVTLTEISQAPESPFSAFKHELHAFKGACASVGAMRLAALMRSYETDLTLESSGSFGRILPELTEMLAATRKAIGDYLGSKK
jgi:HPt (histidine-containing phosphotransfer) domain-containing protein